MKRIIVSHFPYNGSFSNGVINYTKAVNSVIDANYKIVYKGQNETQEAFRNRLLRMMKFNYSPEEVIIEVAESQASALLIPRGFNVHVRMHCPFYLYKKIIKEEPDEQRFSEEVRGIYKARAVSSPSHGMLNLLKNELDIDDIHVFKNPIDLTNVDLSDINKDIDVVFLLRFNRLKGVEYLNPILRMLPESYNVILIGKQEEKFYLDSRVRCKVTIREHVEGDEKFEILKRAKVSLSLSKFENCSMVILESIGVGTSVVCWDVGGNAEIASPSIISVIDYEDVFAFTDKIKEIVDNYNNNSYPPKEAFEEAIKRINEDYINGTKFIETNISNKSGVYKGLDYSTEHAQKKHIPYELKGHSWNDLEYRPIKFLALLNDSESVSTLYHFFKSNDFAITILSRCENNFEYNDVYTFNWVARLQMVHEKIKDLNPDIIIVEDVGFTDDVKKNIFIKSLKKPVVFLSKINSNLILDRHGWHTDSYIANRKIKIDNVPQLNIYPRISTNVLIVPNQKQPSYIHAIEKIKEKLIAEYNIQKAYVIGELPFYDSFFETLDNDEISIHEGDITDIIFLDDFMCVDYLDYHAN
ncbi:glycosyltransferase, partial [Escherichia coli]